MNTSLDNLTHKMQRAALGKIVDVALSRAEHDHEKTMCQLVDVAKQFYGSGFGDETYENAKKVLTDPDSKWTKLINCVLDQTDPHVARTTALNLGYEAFFRGTKTIRETPPLPAICTAWAAGQASTATRTTSALRTWTRSLRRERSWACTCIC